MAFIATTYGQPNLSEGGIIIGNKNKQKTHHPRYHYN